MWDPAPTSHPTQKSLPHLLHKCTLRLGQVTVTTKHWAQDGCVATMERNPHKINCSRTVTAQVAVSAWEPVCRGETGEQVTWPPVSAGTGGGDAWENSGGQSRPDTRKRWHQRENHALGAGDLPLEITAWQPWWSRRAAGPRALWGPERPGVTRGIQGGAEPHLPSGGWRDPCVTGQGPEQGTQPLRAWGGLWESRPPSWDKGFTLLQNYRSVLKVKRDVLCSRNKNH